MLECFWHENSKYPNKRNLLLGIWKTNIFPLHWNRKKYVLSCKHLPHFFAGIIKIQKTTKSCSRTFYYVKTLHCLLWQHRTEHANKHFKEKIFSIFNAKTFAISNTKNHSFGISAKNSIFNTFFSMFFSN